MTTINLHEYLEKIDRLLTESRTREVSGHCRHILTAHSRHIPTYRALGKALLEQEKYGDAADLFQRVLSADPSDFISHVGLSIVYKEESLLPQAIWHLERAFETQPYNTAIQAELRDLYQRSGTPVPPRLPLTAGATARLYLQGEMYQQAAAVLRTALASEPDRIDLSVLLAETLWRDNQRVDAVEVCRQVLDKLPNCILANAILGEIWLLTGRGEEAQPYLKKVQELTLIDQLHVDVETAVGRALTTEGAPRLPQTVTIGYWEEETGASRQDGDWVSAAAADIPAEGSNVISEAPYDWLSGLSFSETDLPPAVTMADVEEKSTAAAAPLDENWLLDDARQDELSETAVDDSEDSASWLDQLDQPIEEVVVPNTGSFDWLEEPTPVSQTDSFDWLESSDGLAADIDTLTDSDDMADDLFDESAVAESLSEDMPDWLADVAGTASGLLTIDPHEAGSLLSAEETDDLFGYDPATLGDLDDEAPEWLSSATGGTDWLTEADNGWVDGDEETADDLAPETAVDSDLTSDGDIELDAHAATADVPDWLLSTELVDEDIESLAEKSGKQDKTLLDEIYGADAASPDWLDADLPDELDAATSYPVDDDIDSELPDWLLGSSIDRIQELEDAVTANPDDKNPVIPDPDEEPVDAGDELEDAMAWLEDLAATKGGTLLAETPENQDLADLSDDAELPDWLTDDLDESDLTLLAEGLQPLEDESVDAIGLTALLAGADDIADAEPAEDIPEWLQNLAPEQSADTADGSVDSGEDLDWLARIAAGEGAALEEGPTQVDPASESSDWSGYPASVASEADDWLAGLVQADAPPVEEQPTWKWDTEADGDEFFEELTTAAREAGGDNWVADSFADADADEDTADDWAAAIESPADAAGELEAADAFDNLPADAQDEFVLPDDFGLEEYEPEDEAIEEEQPEEIFTDSLDWLENLALEQDDQEEALPSTLQELDSFLSDTPASDWLEGAVDEETAVTPPPSATEDEPIDELSLTALLAGTDLGDTGGDLDTFDTLLEDSAELELDWLEGFEKEDKAAAPVEVAEPVAEQPEIEPDAEMVDANPDWLSEMMADAPIDDLALDEEEAFADTDDEIPVAEPVTEPDHDLVEALASLEADDEADDEEDAFDFAESEFEPHTEPDLDVVAEMAMADLGDEPEDEDGLFDFAEPDFRFDESAPLIGADDEASEDDALFDIVEPGFEPLPEPELETDGWLDEIVDSDDDTALDFDLPDMPETAVSEPLDGAESDAFDIDDLFDLELGDDLFADAPTTLEIAEADEEDLGLAEPTDGLLATVLDEPPDGDDFLLDDVDLAEELELETAVSTEPERKPTGFTDALADLDDAEAWLSDLDEMPDELSEPDTLIEMAGEQPVPHLSADLAEALDWLEARSDEPASGPVTVDVDEDELEDALAYLAQLAADEQAADSADLDADDWFDEAGELDVDWADTAVTITDSQTPEADTLNEDPLAMLEGLLAADDLDFSLDEDAPPIEPGEADDDFGFFGAPSRMAETAVAEPQPPAIEDIELSDETPVPDEVTDDEDPLAMLEGLLAADDLDFSLDEDAPPIEPGEADDDFGFFGAPSRVAETAVAEPQPPAIEDIELSDETPVPDVLTDDEDPLAMLEGLLAADDLDFSLDEDAPPIEPGEADDDFGFFGAPSRVAETAAAEPEPPAPAKPEVEWIDAADMTIIEEPDSTGDLEDDILAEMPEDPDEQLAWMARLAGDLGGEEEAEEASDDGLDWAESEEITAEMPEADEETAVPGWLLGDLPDEEDRSLGETDWLRSLPELDADSWLTEQDDVLARGIDQTIITASQERPATGPLPELAPPPLPQEAPEPEVMDSLIMPVDEPGSSALTVDSDTLTAAREAMAAGEIDQALNQYTRLTEAGEGLVTLITDLETAVDTHPRNTQIQRLLGDVYMRNGQLQKALEVYRRALDQL